MVVLLSVLAQSQPPEDVLHNPSFLVLLGVVATAFISIIVGVVGWLLNDGIKGMRQDIKDEKDERRETDKARLGELEKQGKVLARLEIAEANRVQREAVDDKDRDIHRGAIDKRIGDNEKAVGELQLRLVEGLATIQGQLNGALGGTNKDGS